MASCAEPCSNPRVAPPKLAIDGGTPVRSQPWPAWPRFEADEIEAAREVLASGRVNYWTGDEGRQFERELAQAFGASRAIAVSNGTAALELALRALGIGPGDTVVVPARTFVATASAVVNCGARPRFADVDPISGNVTPESIDAARDARTQAAIVVHLGGWPVELDRVSAYARDTGLALVEDCAQAHGARFGERPVGSWGTIAAFSFCQDKIMTTGGEGGAVLTDDEGLWSAAWSYKDHGKSWSAVYERKHPPGFRWLHESIGTNMRMTEVQAAIGRRQLAKLSDWVEQRRTLATTLARRLDVLEVLDVPLPQAPSEGAFYRLYARVRPERLAGGWTRDRLMQAVSAEGVPCSTGSCSEIYLERAFADEDRPRTRLPHAKAWSEASLCFLVHPTVTLADIEDVATAVEKVAAAATR